MAISENQDTYPDSLPASEYRFDQKSPDLSGSGFDSKSPDPICNGF
jgi:hypothetical protein